jgi:hypothetical protein
MTLQVLFLGYMPLEETTALKAHSHRDVTIDALRPYGALTCKFRNTAAITVACIRRDETSSGTRSNASEIDMDIWTPAWRTAVSRVTCGVRATCWAALTTLTLVFQRRSEPNARTFARPFLCSVVSD